MRAPDINSGRWNNPPCINPFIIMRTTNFRMFRSAATLLAATVLLFVGATNTTQAGTPVSKGFVQPHAPSPSAKPDEALPNLGRDKHGMPFYHPKQTKRVVRTTAYTHSESDHMTYGARNAIGTRLLYTDKYRSAAADWSVYPLGTQFVIKGQPYIYVVDDYGSALVGTGTIDIYQPSHTLMRQWGRRVVEIDIIKWGSPSLSLKMLESRRGYAHCAKMHNSLAQQQSLRAKTNR